MNDKIEFTGDQVWAILNDDDPDFAIHEGPDYICENFINVDDDHNVIFEDMWRVVVVDKRDDEHRLYRIRYWEKRIETEFSGSILDLVSDAVFIGVRVFPRQITKTIYAAPNETDWQAQI